jgi:hypothetical protein
VVGLHDLGDLVVDAQDGLPLLVRLGQRGLELLVGGAQALSFQSKSTTSESDQVPQAKTGLAYLSISLQKNTLQLRNVPLKKQTQNVRIENNVQICMERFCCNF